MRRPIRISDERGREIVMGHVAKLNLDGKAWQVTIEPHKKRRSLDQNALWHKWVGIIASETGNDFETVKATLKDMFMTPKEREAFGRRVLIRETSKADVAEMSELMTRTIAFASQELGILLPVPEELGREHA